jgi:hypothetical protein
LATREQRKREKYEREHKIIEGIDYKLCNKHHIFFPEESPWIPATTEYFYYSKCNSMDHLHPCCIKCGKIKSIQWQKDNPEWYKELSHKKNINPNPKTKKTWKNHSQEQRDEGYRKEWEDKNPIKIRQYTENRKVKIHCISAKEWTFTKLYFGNACAYCGLKIEDHFKKYKGILRPQDLHRDHKDDNGANDISNCVPACNSCNSSKYNHPFKEWYTVNNPVFSQERLNKINKWLDEDYKLYIEVKPPYKIIKKQNENKIMFHFELWSMDKQCKLIELISIKNNRKDLDEDIKIYFPN